MKNLTLLRALMTQNQSSTSQAQGVKEPPQTSLQPPPRTSPHLHPRIMLAARAQLLPMLTVDPLGKPGSQARLPLLWAG